MKIISYNIKHIFLDDILWFWRKRYRKVVDFIKGEKPDILGTQELTKKAKKYLKRRLKDYHIIGESRNSKFPTNEYNCLVISNKYKMLSYKTYSLSDNVEELGTKAEEDNYPRICVIAHIEYKNNNYLIINTHIDNSNSNNKKRLLDILKKIIENEKKKNEYIVVMGDFNMTIDNNNLADFSKGFKDPFKNNTDGTFPSLPNLKALDHIFIDKKLRYDNDIVYSNTNNNGFISDHFPIGCNVFINEKRH